VEVFICECSLHSCSGGLACAHTAQSCTAPLVLPQWKLTLRVTNSRQRLDSSTASVKVDVRFYGFEQHLNLMDLFLDLVPTAIL